MAPPKISSPSRQTTRKRKSQGDQDSSASAKRRSENTEQQASNSGVPVVTREELLAQLESGASSDPRDNKRPKRFRKQAPSSFYTIYDRATSQRFFVLSRTQMNSAQGCPEEMVEIAGSTGNIYHVHICQVPSCTCPHARKGNQCKHILFVMSTVLRAKFDLVYQLGLTRAELQDIIWNAPPIEVGNHPSVYDDDTGEVAAASSPSDSNVKNTNRKAIEGDCPICFSPLVDSATTSSSSSSSSEDLVYCRAQCGQNLHKECFEMWAKTKRSGVGERVTCPMCRTPWQADEAILSNIKHAGVMTDEGYVNVASQLGISQRRDTSTYHSRSRYGRGGGYYQDYYNLDDYGLW